MEKFPGVGPLKNPDGKIEPAFKFGVHQLHEPQCNVFMRIGEEQVLQRVGIWSMADIM
jgi:hypothetical protein